VLENPEAKPGRVKLRTSWCRRAPRDRGSHSAGDRKCQARIRPVIERVAMGRLIRYQQGGEEPEKFSESNDIAENVLKAAPGWNEGKDAITERVNH